MILKDKTLVVTGVGDGLGREVADLALRDGANVVLAARTEATLAAAAKEMDESGDRVAYAVTDVNDEEQCLALASLAKERFGGVDALVQVAAFENCFGGLHESKFERWRQCFDTNVLGALSVIRAVEPVMKEGGGGSIVLIGSQSMFMPSMPQAGYAASKGALLSAMYYLADELGPENIRVNMVVPSWMWGPPVKGLVNFRAENEEKTEDEVVAEITGKFPLRRMTCDEEVAEVAIFFASDRARAITGQHIMVNSGEIMR